MKITLCRVADPIQKYRELGDNATKIKIPSTNCMEERQKGKSTFKFNHRKGRTESERTKTYCRQDHHPQD